MLVVLDPGHGGDDPGAVGPKGTREKDITLIICTQTMQLLEQQGVEVVMTRTKDQTPNKVSDNQDLQERCDIANAAKADVFVSIHCNAATNPNARGAESFCYEGSTEGYKLADDCLLGLVNAVPVNVTKLPQVVKLSDLATLDNRGTKTSHFYVLKYTNMVSCLVETAFISNPAEEDLLNSPDFQAKASEGIAKGICTYLGVKWNQPAPAPLDPNAVRIVVGSKALNGLLVGDSTYAPVRVLAEALGYKVAWDEKTKTVTITK